MNTDSIIFDIETAPLPFDQVKHMAPKELVDGITQDMIQEKADAMNPNWKPDTRMEKALKWADSWDLDRERHDWQQSGLTDPRLSYICAYGITPDVFGEHELRLISGPEDEKVALDRLCRELNNAGRAIGHYIHRFDLPFIMRRLWLNGGTPWSYLNGRYSGDKYVDTWEVWHCFNGSRDAAPGSLDSIAQAFGLPKKPGSGDGFHLMSGHRQIEYLTHDLEATSEIARRMGLLS